MGYNAPTNTYDSFDDLRLAIGQASSSVTVLGRDNAYDALGGTFSYVVDMVEPDDNCNIIQPLNAPGRWVRVTSGMPFSGTAILYGDGTTTIFDIYYNNIVLLHTNYQISITPLTFDAWRKWEIIKGNDGFTITFDVAPPIGNQNVQFDYFVRYLHEF